MENRNLRQTDILRLAMPYVEKAGLKMNRSDLSQYVSGKVEPGTEKLEILAKALKVSEVWLMGYDDEMEHAPNDVLIQTEMDKSRADLSAEFRKLLSYDNFGKWLEYGEWLLSRQNKEEKI